MAPWWGDRNGEWPPASVPCPATEADTYDLVCHGEVLSCDLIPWGSNYTFLAALSRTGETEALGIYKPRRGEAPLWDFPDGTLYRRERAAYVAAQALGWEFIPLTVIRDGPHGIGSMQLFVQTEGSPHRPPLTEVHRPELSRIALFDLIANNADRKAGHCLVGTNGRVWGIDHGLTFHTDPKLRTVLGEFYRDEIAAELLADLRTLLGNAARRGALTAQLGELLDHSEVKGFFARAERVTEAGGSYPSLEYYRRRSWPF
jgi:hypothetical protein